jgi:hypothetical protein
MGESILALLIDFLLERASWRVAHRPLWIPKPDDVFLLADPTQASVPTAKRNTQRSVLSCPIPFVDVHFKDEPALAP